MVSGVKYLIHFEGFFLMWCDKADHFYYFASSCPIFPTPFTEEVVTSPLYTLVSFVVDELII